MTRSLVDVLGQRPEDEHPLAIVSKVNADGTVDLSLDGGTASGVEVLEWYAPRSGDTVVVMRRNGQRLLVLGRVRTSNETSVDVSRALTLAWNVAPALTTLPNPFVLNAIDTHSARGGDWERDEIYQGAYVPAYGYWRGCFFYGNGVAPLRGRRVTRIRIDLHRLDEGGNNGGVPIHVAGHIHPTRPASAPVFTTGAHTAGSLARPGSGTSSAVFDLPVSWGQALADGTLKGFGTRYDGTAHYAILASLQQVATQGRLTIDWA